MYFDYIHNWSLQPLSQDYDLVSHNTYVMCVNFIHEEHELHFKFGCELLIFEKIFMEIFYISSKFFQQSAERKPPKKYFNIFSF